jgi:hypothetical protein
MHRSRLHHTTGGYHRITMWCAKKWIHWNDAKRSTMHPWLILDTVFHNSTIGSHTRLYFLHFSMTFTFSVCVCSWDQASRSNPSIRWVWHQTLPLGMTITYPHGQWETFVPRKRAQGLHLGILTLVFFGTTYTCLAVVCRTCIQP